MPLPGAFKAVQADPPTSASGQRLSGGLSVNPKPGRPENGDCGGQNWRKWLSGTALRHFVGSPADTTVPPVVELAGHD